MPVVRRIALMATLIDLGLFGVPLFRPPVFARPLWNRVSGDGSGSQAREKADR